MLLTNKMRKLIFKFSYVETLSIVAVYLLIGYLVNPDDICMLEGGITFLTIVLAIITLFHGSANGLLAMAIIGIFMNVSYPLFDYTVFLQELVLVLVFGEFHYYWQRTIDKHTTQAKFTEIKLSELGKAFYMLKISHDQLEKNYVTKPMSLRNSIRLIKENFVTNVSHESYDDFLTLLQKTLNIEEAYLGTLDKKEKLTIVASTKGSGSFHYDDIMLEVAIEKAMPIYVSSDEKYNESEYLAVIPAISDDKIVGMLVIEKMPFMSFNKDSLITLAILVTYLFEELHKLEILKSIGDFFHNYQENFRFEMFRLYDMNQKFNIQSSVLVFQSSDKLITHLLLETIGKNLRSLDVMSYYSDGNKDYIAVLFPFADDSSTVGFVKRIYTLLDFNDKTNIKYSTFDISQKSLIESYSGH
ncbi:MAG: PelD GGDEF domain-containing protein [Campylobacterota bacterium]|nr:PelD GGDEF domain-containing protein [Campylobacterota bacterium]